MGEGPNTDFDNHENAHPLQENALPNPGHVIPLAEPYTWPISDDWSRQYENILESYVPAPVIAAKTSTYAIEVGTTATLIWNPQHYPAAARVMVQNLSGADLFIGGADVTIENGTVLTHGSTIVLETQSPNQFYGVAAAAQTSPADTRVFVEGL